MEKNIQQIETYLKKLNKREDDVVGRIFSFHTSESKMKLPFLLRGKLAKQFNIKELETQKIVRVDNLFTRESTIFNALRKKRPEQKSKEGADLNVKDAFCSPYDSTPIDVVGRIEGKYALTAANLTKYNEYHSLVIFKRHNPLEITYAAFDDALEIANKWFERIHAYDRDAVYPWLIWNYLWKAGASIIHPHLQVILSKKPFPKQEAVHDAIHLYKENYDGNYLDDFYKAHKVLGLGIEHKGIKIVAHLTPIKEKEIIVIGRFNEEFRKMIFDVLKFYKKEGVQSFDMALSMPPLDNSSGNLMCIARLVDRGSLTITTADFGAMEIYSGTHIVSSDPYKLIKELKQII